jgi:hypothetical protein
MSGSSTPKPDATLSLNWQRSLGGAVRSTMWPTRGLRENERWFDELYVWTEGFQASTMQRARLQLNALRKGFALLELERVEKIGVTLSFGTVERALDHATAIFDENRLLAHRISVILRGQIERLRSPYRVQSFIDWLRTQQIPVGYRISAARIGMEMKAIDLLKPDFAKLTAPASARLEYWQDAMLEARAAGLATDWIIVSDLETEEQRKLAMRAGFRFGQGTAVRPAYEPPSTRNLRQPTLPGIAEPPTDSTMDLSVAFKA